MKELIGMATLVAALFGGTLLAEKIYQEVRIAALTKASKGLPKLAPFAAALTRNSQKQLTQPDQKIGRKPKDVPL